ncbi:MAG: hypothetical protein ACXWQO_03735 [Bdellovibrionota bacterium]
MKTLLITAMLFAAASLPAFAKPRVSSGSSARSSASQSPAAECLQTALNGRIEGECAEDAEADQCVGMKLALKNSLRQDQCRARAGEGCLIYGYKQNTQAQWLSVAGGYLTEALQCVRSQYGNEESTGYEQALADPVFRANLNRLEEGVSAFGLREGALLERVLKGETLGEVLSSSPVWQKLDAREKDRMKLAMDNPMAPVESAESAGTNSKKHAHEASYSTPVVMATDNAPIVNAVAAIETPRNPASVSSKPEAAVPGNVFVRVLKHNPYSLGLDLTLFDRVSTAYQKRGQELRGIEDYVKGLPKRREPRDAHELIGRNVGAEL